MFIPGVFAASPFGAAMSFVANNIPQLWDILNTTIAVVAIHFRESSDDEKKDIVLKNMSAWYRLVDKQANFKDETDDFILNQFLPDAINWVHTFNKMNLKILVQNIFSGDTLLDAAEKARLQAGTLSIHIDPTMPSQPVVVSLISGADPLKAQEINWGPKGRPENLPLLNELETESGYTNSKSEDLFNGQ